MFGIIFPPIMLLLLSVPCALFDKDDTRAVSLAFGALCYILGAALNSSL